MERVNPNAIVFLPWTSIEAGAQRQILNTASMPFIFKHVAVMPDCHYGKGATVGTVLATKGAVIPAAVGVDIGCGMIAVRTPLKRADIPKPGAVRAGQDADRAAAVEHHSHQSWRDSLRTIAAGHFRRDGSRGRPRAQRGGS